MGLDHTPIKQVIQLDRTTTVVGYGTLLLPNPRGMGVISQEVLLFKEVETTIDSFFNAGAPFPPTQLIPFGLEQGHRTNTTGYSFIAKNLPRKALIITLVNDEVRGGSISNDIGNTTTSIHSFEKNLVSTSIFPNPSPGTFQIDFDKIDGQDWQINLYNPLGQLVQQHNVKSAKGPVTTAITIPKGSSGMYHFTIQRADGVIVGTDKILITKTSK